MSSPPTQPPIDVVASHRFFSAECYNKTWELMRKADRTPEEDILMVSLSHASVYHWTQRADCKPINVSIGFWQLSRVNAVIGRPTDAYSYAVLCLAKSDTLPPFYRAYAYEALARAEKLANNASAANAHLTMARSLAALVESAEERAMVCKDLDELDASADG